MLIQVAENGKKYDLDCGSSTSVDVVQRSLASLTGMLATEQMLICGDTRLEPARTLGSYGLPAEGRPVFLFNRNRLLTDAPPPPPEVMDEISLQLPVPKNPLDAAHPLDDSPNPLLRALPTYERQFDYHQQKAEAIWRASQERYIQSKQLFEEMDVQAAAIRTARGNMDIYYGHMRSRYGDFLRACNEQQRRHSEVLGNFERDVARLRACELHPALRTEQRRSLLDCVNEAGIRRWAEDCSMSHTQFGAKVAELRGQFTGLQRCVEELMMTAPDVDMEQLECDLEDHQQYLDEEATILQSLKKDSVTVRKLLKDCESGAEMSSSFRPLDAVAALDPMSELHLNSHLPQVESCDRKMGELLAKMRSCKHAMTRCVHSQLQSVAALQRRIRDMRNQLAGYKEAMHRQEEVFAELILVRKVASAYHACMAEVVRRRAFADLYMGEAARLAEHMARARDAEAARREQFIQAQGLLPRDILEAMGLFGVPSQCEVNVPASDAELLEVTEADLQYLARTIMSGPEPGVPEDMRGRRGRSFSEGSSRGSGMLLSSGGGSMQEEGRQQDAGVKEGAPKFGGNLELQNAWLRAEYASAVAMLCSVEEGESGGEESGAAKKVAEALELKDKHTEQLQATISKQKEQLEAYERRIRDLEGWVAQQHSTATQSPQAQVQAAPSGGELGGGSVVMAGGQSEVATEKEVEKGVEEGPSVQDHTMMEMAGEGAVDARMGDSATSVVSTAMDAGGPPARPEGEDGGLELRRVVAERTAVAAAAETRLAAAVAESADLRGQLERNQGLLQECQMNCAHLENQLHKAREEARTHLCAADRREAEYRSLRAASVRLHSLMQRLSRCLAAPPGTFPETLAQLASSLSAPRGPDVEEGGGQQDTNVEWFRGAVGALAEQVGQLVRHRGELVARVHAAEEAKVRLKEQVESAAEQLRGLAAKHERAVQLCKEKICFTSFNVQELAVFLPNAQGHYEAVNRSCPNHYLSSGSIALFLQHQSNANQYIVGQIVHIDHGLVKPLSKDGGASPGGSPTGSPPAGGLFESEAVAKRWNPYDLPVGTEFAIVTLAMVPDLAGAGSSQRLPI